MISYINSAGRAADSPLIIQIISDRFLLVVAHLPTPMFLGVVLHDIDCRAEHEIHALEEGLRGYSRVKGDEHVNHQLNYPNDDTGPSSDRECLFI